MADIDIIVRARVGNGKSTLVHELKTFLEVHGIAVELGPNETADAPPTYEHLRNQTNRMNALRERGVTVSIDSEAKPRQ